MYILARSAANSADSSPPSPDLTSSTMSSASCGSRGASMSVSWVSSSATRASSSVTSSANDSSSAASSRAVSRSSRADSSLRYVRDDRGQSGEPASDFARLVGLAVQFGIGQRAARARRVRRAGRQSSAPAASCHTSYRSAAAFTPNANRRPACADISTVRASVSQLFVGRPAWSARGCALRLP